MPIDLDRRSATSLRAQIAEAIVADIRRGRLAPGTALPGSRELSTTLGVTRKTVAMAYDDLTAQGWLQAHERKATVVSSTLPKISDYGRGRDRSSSKAAPEHRIPEASDFELVQQRDVRHLVPVPGTLAFDDGTPDARLARVDLIGRLLRTTFLRLGRQNGLSYADPRGSLRLRRSLSRMLNSERGLNTTPEHICLTRGSQMGIYVCAKLLVRPGDTIAVESPGYRPAWEAFASAGAKILPVSVDADGLQVDELERLCRNRRIRGLYVTPHHQFPTTVRLSTPRRYQLIAMAARHDFIIVEDDYDHEFHFGSRPLMPIAGLNEWGRIIYVGSLSKLLMPGLRCGYLIAPVRVIDEAVKAIGIIDRHGNLAVEETIATLIDSGEIRRHAKRTLREYEVRRNELARLLRERFVERVRFAVPKGGLAIWAQLDEDLPVSELASYCLQERLIITPGGIHSLVRPPPNALRLGFASMRPVELAAAVQR
jgi:GntR family transcriptional regulator/MocR family aminotransferase